MDDKLDPPDASFELNGRRRRRALWIHHGGHDEEEGGKTAPPSHAVTVHGAAPDARFVGRPSPPDGYSFGPRPPTGLEGNPFDTRQGSADFASVGLPDEAPLLGHPHEAHW